jgi:hypothetical protein
MGTSLFTLGTVRAINRTNETPEMIAFWNAYPRQVGKGAVRIALRKALKKTTIETILDALARTNWNPDPQFIPHPTTWLNRESWDDLPPKHIDQVARILGL